MKDLIEYKNFFNLQYCLKEATKQCQIIYKKRWQEIFGTAWADNQENAAYFATDRFGRKIRESLVRKGKKSQVSLDTGNSSEWDLTLFGAILTSEPFKSGNFLDQIQTLIDIRNTISHTPGMNITNEVFEQLYARLSNAMKQLGYSETSLKILIENVTFEKQDEDVIHTEKTKEVNTEPNYL